MGFLFTPLEAPPVERRKTASMQMMHELGCKVCPLQAGKGCNNPRLKPTGNPAPVVYMLGSHPKKQDDEDNMQFSPDTMGGRFLRHYIPEDFEQDVRFNYIVRTYADDGHKPTSSEIECCRKSVEQDIIESEPIAIFGFGTQVLQWVRPGLSIADIRGRKFPVKIGDFTTWFFCLEDPEDLRKPVLNKWGKWFVDPQKEFVWKLDLKRAFAALENLTTPSTISHKEAFAGVEAITKRNGGVQRVVEALRWASAQPKIGFDYETPALRPYRDSGILTVGLATDTRAVAFGLHHREAWWTQDELDQIYYEMEHFLMSPARKLVHQLAFELEWTGVTFGREFIRTDTWDDSMSQAFIIDERTSKKKRRGPGSLHFGMYLYRGLPIKDLSPEIDDNSKKNMAAVSLDSILPYNALDAKGHFWLFESQEPIIREQGLHDAYRMKIDHVKTVVLTQIKGAPIDPDANQALFEDYTVRVENAMANIERSPHWDTFKQMFNRFFNPASEDDIGLLLGKIIKTRHGLNQDGSYTTDKETLLKVRDPIIQHILAHRRAAKALSTYVIPLRPDSEHNYDSWMHPIYNTNSTGTGRLSCVAEWTPVLTKSGHKPIKDVKVGDLVWTHKRRWRPVINNWSKGVEQMIDIHFPNGEVLTCTKNHRLLSSSGEWVFAGELYERFQAMAGGCLQSRERLEALSIARLENHGADSGRAWDHGSECMGSFEQLHVREGAQGFISHALLCVENGGQKPSIQQDGFGKPELEGHFLRSKRIHDYQDSEGQARLRSSEDICRSLGTGGITRRIRDSSHRWGWREQLARQFSPDHEKRASCYPCLATAGAQAGTIEKIELGKSLEVYDLTVADDESYESCGVFSHNSEEPNAQNFPVRDPEMGAVRAQVADTPKNRRKGEPRKLIMKVDMGQIEARVIAMVTKDPAFVKALWERFEVHGAWAEKIEKRASQHGVNMLKRFEAEGHETLKAQMKALRNVVKNRWTFPLFFGARRESVASFLQVDQRIIDPLFDEWWTVFKGVHEWQDRLRNEYKQNGEITYITGRKVRAPISDNQLFNYPIQGPTADLVLDSMKRVSALSADDWNFQPIFQIHDDLTFLLPEDTLADYAEKIIEIMLFPKFDFINVPITLEVAIGPNWHDVESKDFDGREMVFSSDTWKKAQ